MELNIKEKIIGLILETKDTIRFLSDKKTLNRIEEAIALEMLIKSKPKFEKKLNEIVLKQNKEDK